MAWTRIKDAVVKTGEYTNNNGETKARYENVGSGWKSDDGSFMVTLKRTFNPAGVPNPDNKDQVVISLYDIQKNEPAAPPPKPKPAPVVSDEDIPF